MRGRSGQEQYRPSNDVEMEKNDEMEKKRM